MSVTYIVCSSNKRLCDENNIFPLTPVAGEIANELISGTAITVSAAYAGMNVMLGCTSFTVYAERNLWMLTATLSGLFVTVIYIIIQCVRSHTVTRYNAHRTHLIRQQNCALILL